MARTYLQTAFDMIETAGAEALAGDAPEAAIRALARGCYDTLGDREVHTQAGSLKPGEQQFFVAGGFFVTPDEKYHLLVGNCNFPPEQERLMIPIDGGHLGWVYENKAKLLLENTDEHGDFRQYLKTSRMGSAIYAPMFWEGVFIGQMVMAAQARRTMREDDLRVLVACSRIATGAWVAKGGPEWLKRLYPPKNAFRVGADGM
ncbi:MAG: GAF domain-containing protein [Hyphomicrobiaceae bacterium]